MASPTFHWADYLLFVLMLVISTAIGIYHACQSRRGSVSVDTHLTGGRKMSLIPVTFSISVSFMSAVFVLGIPSEIYNNGGLYLLYAFGYIPVYIVTAFVFVPMFTKLNLSSGYQYLEKRFNGYIRVLGSATFTIEMVVYMGVVMYAPALALSQVTTFSTELSILIMGLVCTFYTSIGGIKAVIWTDVFQTLIITAGLLALMIQGAVSVGGWGVVFDRAREGNKLPYFEMNPDPFVRHTFWTLTVGGFFTSITVFAANQAVLQRYMSLPSTKQAKISLLVNLPLAEFYLALVCLTGFVLYARYYDEDPFQTGSISSRDQIVPLFMMEVFSFLPGLPGLFVACVFSAALSTVSSGVNSLAVVTVFDFIKPLLDKSLGRTPARILSILSVAVALGYGIITTGMAYLSGLLGSTVLQIALSIFGMVGGPLLGLFVNGMFFPCVNPWGAAAGLVCSLSVCLWLGIGGVLYKAGQAASTSVNATFINSSSTVNSSLHYSNIITSSLYNNVSSLGESVLLLTDATVSTVTSGLDSTTAINMTTQAPPVSGLDTFLSKWYSLSYLHFATVALIVSIVTAVLVSACTGFNKKRYVDRETYYDLLCCCNSDRSQEFDLQSYRSVLTETSMAKLSNGNKADLIRVSTSSLSDPGQPDKQTGC